MNFALRLKELREKRHLSQKELAGALGEIGRASCRERVWTWV